jgi:hypothetical protein
VTWSGSGSRTPLWPRSQKASTCSKQARFHSCTAAGSTSVPAPRPHVASFLLSGAREPSTSIDVQLAAVAGCPPSRLRADLDVVWRGDLPADTKRILDHGGGPRIAEALRQYWQVAVRPFWPQIRAVLDADVAWTHLRTRRILLLLYTVIWV